MYLPFHPASLLILAVSRRVDGVASPRLRDIKPDPLVSPQVPIVFAGRVSKAFWRLGNSPIVTLVLSPCHQLYRRRAAVKQVIVAVLIGPSATRSAGQFWAGLCAREQLTPVLISFRLFSSLFVSFRRFSSLFVSFRLFSSLRLFTFNLAWSLFFSSLLCSARRDRLNRPREQTMPRQSMLQCKTSRSTAHKRAGFVPVRTAHRVSRTGHSDPLLSSSVAAIAITVTASFTITITITKAIATVIAI
ncbi:unnamed protein product [Protopolystoma xenopodis]|uniref:Uncharacterized protein n=1 Tax=Protopolystoma xenopodis TaxID=117903 RepID=A0A448WVR9_9PLAT|nr:unnamed protein product [Protopolystoma xenopodis]